VLSVALLGQFSEPESLLLSALMVLAAVSAHPQPFPASLDPEGADNEISCTRPTFLPLDSLVGGGLCRGESPRGFFPGVFVELV
jgi:hypothetical protein